jgi:hypothetical protein
MHTKVIILALALGASTCLVTAQDGDQRPDRQPPPGREDGPGRPGGPGGQGGFRLIPPRAQEQLDLTAEQQKEVTDLEAKTRAKLEKILTPEQMQQLRQMRPMQRQAGPGGPGAPGGAGGPGEQGGRPGGAGGPGGFGNGPGGMDGQRPVMPIIAALDLNKDGIIDADEIAKASESLKKLDKNGDGKLTPDEYLPQRGQGGPWMRGPGGPGGPGMRGPGGQGGPNGPGGPPPADDQNPPRQRPQGE